LISQQNFCEVAYEDLDRDPLREVERIYQSLALPDFGRVAPALREYLKSLAGYTKNRFPELPARTRDEIASRWARCFEEWGYEK
jgi:hypothetical protein